MARAYTRHDWSELDPLIDRLIHEEGYTVEQACQDLGIKPSTYRMHQRTRESGTPEAHQSTPLQDASDQEHLSTPESTDMAEAHQSIPEHQGTLEGYQEVMEDVQASVPEIPQLVTDEVHPDTPEAHLDVSLRHSGVPLEHSDVPARQDHLISTSMGHPGTPTSEDWELWTIIKARWAHTQQACHQGQ